ncbi:MAG TPA: M36 family metallopeptidase, partial [Candidatus Polarisedimenticolia bacterium]|nr:M36 family metallopeptidase [Candidatus Polarisedimenticolia bacterium]
MTVPARIVSVSLLVSLFGVSGTLAKKLPNYDAGASRTKGAAREFVLRPEDRHLLKPGTEVQTDPYLGIPTFLWASREGSPGTASKGRESSEQAARRHIGRYAGFYRLGPHDIADAQAGVVHDTGSGVIIVPFRQRVSGIDVFRDEMKVALTQDLDLVAISGYLTPAPATAVKGGPPRFELDAAEAISVAWEDLTETSLDFRDLQKTGRRQADYEFYEIEPRAADALTPKLLTPARVKKVLFRVSENLEPAYALELEVGSNSSVDSDSFSYVISATDGALLFRKDMTANDTFSYRVWAESTGQFIPFDGPQGNAPTPHPTGAPDAYQAPFLTPSLVTLQNGPISTNDAWLAPTATTTSGNNADAYVDIAAPSGFSAGDLRASTTSTRTFDRTYDTTLAPGSSSTQRMAAVTQLFFVVNFLHDWFYDAGFNEAAGNAQTNNFGRGGLQNDNIRAEGQDFSGRNNANMTTPSDGGRPTMQMYVFDGNAPRFLTITSPAAIAGIYPVGYAVWGPIAFSTTADIVRVTDITAPTNDGCETLTSSVAGKIAFIDRGLCTFTDKVERAQAAGAVGVIIANVPTSVDPSLQPIMGGTPVGSVTIGTLSLNLSDGDAIRAQFPSTVHGTLQRDSALDRDGTIDSQIIAHEWGHYISNRLIGNGFGLGNLQGSGMGEGWGDFHALPMTVRAEDALTPTGA